MNINDPAAYENDGNFPPTPESTCPACGEYRNQRMIDALAVLRDLADLAEEFRGRGIYAEGNAIIDRAWAVLGESKP